MEADVDPKNRSSLRLLERQGFRREGYLRERWQLEAHVVTRFFRPPPQFERLIEGDDIETIALSTLIANSLARALDESPQV